MKCTLGVILTTVNPDTGEKSKRGEPLMTLRKYRSKPLYGHFHCCCIIIIIIVIVIVIIIII